MVTGTIGSVEYPTKAVPTKDVKIRCPVTWAGAAILGEDMYLFVIDQATPTTCMKGEKWYTTTYGVPTGSGSKTVDITFTMPDKNLNFYVELWTEVPTKYTGKCTIETWT